MRKKDYDLNARFQQAVDAIALGYIEDEDVAELKKLVKMESRLRADSDCSPVEYHTESLRQLLQETPTILNMSDKRGRNLLKIAEQTNNATHESAVSIIKEESDRTRWRRSASDGNLTEIRKDIAEASSIIPILASSWVRTKSETLGSHEGKTPEILSRDDSQLAGDDAPNVRSTMRLGISHGHAEKIIKEREKIQSNPDLQTLADIEGQRIRANLYHKLGVGKASTSSVDISK